MANTIISPVIYSKKWIKNYDLATVMPDLVNTTYQGDMMANGTTLHAQQFQNVTIQTYTPGSDIPGQSVTVTDSTLSVNQKKAILLYIDAMEIRQSHLPLINGFMKRTAVAFANDLDDFLLGMYSNVASQNIIGSDANPLQITPANIYDYVVQADELMNAAGVPMEGRVFVHDEKVRSAILRSPDYVKATATGDQIIRKGEIGFLGNFRCVMSPRIATVSGVRNNMFFHPDFIELVVQLDSSTIMETGKAEKQLATYIKSGALYGAACFQSTAGVVLKRAA